MVRAQGGHHVHAGGGLQQRPEFPGHHPREALGPGVVRRDQEHPLGPRAPLPGDRGHVVPQVFCGELRVGPALGEEAAQAAPPDRARARGRPLSPHRLGGRGDDLLQRGVHVDGVRGGLAGGRFERRVLAVQERRRHEVVLPGGHPPGDHAPLPREVDEADGPRLPEPVPVRLPEGRARQGRSTVEVPLPDRFGHGVQPRGPIGVGERRAAGHLLDVRPRVEAVRVFEPEPQPLGHPPPHLRLAAAGDTHEDMRHLCSLRLLRFAGGDFRVAALALVARLGLRRGRSPRLRVGRCRHCRSPPDRARGGRVSKGAPCIPCDRRPCGAFVASLLLLGLATARFGGAATAVRAKGRLHRPTGLWPTRLSRTEPPSPKRAGCKAHLRQPSRAVPSQARAGSGGTPTRSPGSPRAEAQTSNKSERSDAKVTPRSGARPRQRPSSSL